MTTPTQQPIGWRLCARRVLSTTVFCGALVALLWLPGRTTLARSVEPGTVSFAAVLGPGARLGSAPLGSKGYLMVSTEVDYAFSKRTSLVGDLTFGIAGSNPLRLDLGGRWRAINLNSPWSPFVQLQASGGRLFDAEGTNLTYLGARAGFGCEYFVTAHFAADIIAGFTLASTLSDASDFYGIFETLIGARYSF